MNVESIPSELESVWIDLCTPWRERDPDTEQILRQLAFAKARGVAGVNCLGPLGESQALAHWQIRDVVETVCGNPFGLPVAVEVDHTAVELARWVVRLAANCGASVIRWRSPLYPQVDEEDLLPWTEAVAEEAERVGVRLEGAQGYVTERNRFPEWINGAVADAAKGNSESAAEKWRWIQGQVEGQGRIATPRELKEFLVSESVIDSAETRFPYA